MTNPLANFDAIYVINLESRPDKLELFNAGLKKSGFADDLINKIIRFPGIVSQSKIGYEGCLLSHMQIIKEARGNGLKNVLIFEDDASFIGKINDLQDSIDQAFSTDWSIFYLGYNCVNKVNQISRNLVHLTKSYTTHAIAYNASFFDYALESMSRGVIKIIDVWLANEIQYKFKCIGAYPMQFSQLPGRSDVENRDVNYDFIIERSIKNIIPLKNE